MNTANHVTLRLCWDVKSLRTKERVRVVRQVLARGCAKPGFRVTQYTVMSSHLHMVIEADSKRRLSSGMNGLASRLGRRINDVSGRTGRVFADRYHAHVLRSAREIRNSLAYVLLNLRRHTARNGRCYLKPEPDPFSSGPMFDGWKEKRETSPPDPDEGPCIAEPLGWLLKFGWRRRGLISLSEVPGPKSASSVSR